MPNGESFDALEFAADQAVSAEIGSVVGNFRIAEKLGEGGCGVVYKARDTVAERDVALKMLRIDDQDRRELIVNEARKAASLQHPNIVSILHVTSCSENPFYLVMEYVDGASLAQVIRDEAPLPEEAVFTIVRALSSGLAHAHLQGIVHLDIKPENILLERDRATVHITDFGMAIHDSERWSRDSGGTLLYMAPEQIERRSEQYDGRTDIWAIGVVMYELLTGRRPFGAGHRATIGQICKEILKVQPKPPSQWNPSVSERSDFICLKCLEKDLLNRYTSVTRLLEDLEDAETYLGRAQNTEVLEQEDEDATSNAWETAIDGCLVAIGIIMVVTLLIFGILDPDDTGRFLKKVIRILPP
jgi:serine/threonine protein kinase